MRDFIFLIHSFLFFFIFYPPARPQAAFYAAEHLTREALRLIRARTGGLAAASDRELEEAMKQVKTMGTKKKEICHCRLRGRFSPPPSPPPPLRNHLRNNLTYSRAGRFSFPTSPYRYLYVCIQ
jgi:hypothetical protein